MHFSVLPPSQALAPYIKTYWFLEDENGFEMPYPQRIFPHGCICTSLSRHAALFLHKMFSMRSYFLVLLIIAAIHKHAASQESKYSKEDFLPLYELAGTWKMETPKGSIYEQWNRQDSYKLSGKSYKLKNTDTMVLEKIELTFNSGNIFYTPSVSDQNNQRPIPFQLVSASNNKFTFENKEHDYPQRIIYHLVSKDSVHARIEGIKNGKEMGSDFFYKRVQ